MFWQALFSNFAVVALAALAWTGLRDHVPQRLGGTLLGLLMAAAACLSITFAVKAAPGMFFDLRAAPLVLAGFFGGLPAAGIAGAIAGAFRLSIGGPGALAGAAAVLFACTTGCLGHRRMKATPVRAGNLAVLGLAAGVGTAASMLFLPFEVAGFAFRTIVLPATVLGLVSIVAAGSIILQDRRRRDAIEANATYRTIIEALPDGLNVKDLDGRFLIANPATASLMRVASDADLIGRTDFHFYPSDVAARFRADEERAIATGQSTVVEQQACFFDGSSRWLSTLKTPLRDEAGAMIGLVTHNRDITATKAMSDALQRARGQLDGALAHMADGFALFDEEGTLLLCNERFRVLFPLTADLRVPGVNLRVILRAAAERGEEAPPPGPVEAWIEACVEAHRSDNERILQLVDRRWIEFRTRLVAGVGSLIVVTDITARKLADEKLHAAEAEYRELFENAVSGIYRSTVDGKMLRANPALVRLNGYDTEADLVASVGEIAVEWYVEPNRREEFKRILRDEGRVTDFVSEVYRHRTRERIWISEAAWVVRARDGTVLCYEGTVVDAGERKRVEEAVAASEARFRLLADNAADLVALAGADGRFSFVSPASRELLGYEPDELTGTGTLGVIHLLDRPRIAMALHDLKAQAGVGALEFRALRKDGSAIWVEAGVRPLADGTGAVLAIRDISVRKRAEEDLAGAMRQLETLASTDPLTGLSTRRAFEDVLEREFARSARETQPLSLLFIDVDRFKAYNDTYGHTAGDDCLRRLGAVVSSLLRRPGDTGARYGGEEMVGVLPGTGADGAETLAVRIRAAVRDLQIEHKGSEFGLVTVSIGTATIQPVPGHGKPRDLVDAADKALYEAKRGGRDRIMRAA